MYTNNNNIREIHFGVVYWGHFTHISCTTPPNNNFLGVFHWGHFIHISCIPNNNTKHKISKITSLCKNLVSGHNLFLPRSPLIVSLNTLTLRLQNLTSVSSTEVILHTPHVPPRPIITISSKYKKFEQCAKTFSRSQLIPIHVTTYFYTGHHLLWLTTLTPRLENLTLVSYIEVILHTPHAPPT